MHHACDRAGWAEAGKGRSDGYLLPILLLLVAYEAVQCLQWHVLLRPLGTHEPLRAQEFAFLVGAATRALPIGNFGQNDLLQRAGTTDFGLSSAVTLLSVLVAVALAGQVLLGLGSWTWLRPLILVGLAIVVPSAWAISRIQRQRMLPAWLTRQRIVRAALDQILDPTPAAPRRHRGGPTPRALYLR